MMAFLPLILGTEKGRMLAIIGAALLACPVIWGWGFVHAWNNFPRVDVKAIEANAISGRDGYWQQKLAEEAAHHDLQIAAALEAGQAVSVTPVAEPERLRECSRDAHCRDKDRR